MSCVFQDFKYDDQFLGDFGFVVCDFGGGSDIETVSAGSNITFNKVAMQRGKHYSLAGTSFDECITATFDICKDPNMYEDLEITNEEYRRLMRWLNRHEFLPFTFIDKDEPGRIPCYYEASFNIEKITLGHVLYGLRLTLETNKPFGFGKEVAFNWNVEGVGQQFSIFDESDDIGYIYPDMEITIKQAGDFKITNEQEDCTMIIKNCVVDEVISVYGKSQILLSSVPEHKVCDDFNYEFFRIGNSYYNRDNRIKVYLPCEITIKYFPIIKDSPT